MRAAGTARPSGEEQEPTGGHTCRQPAHPAPRLRSLAPLQLHATAAVIGRALLDHQRRLVKSAGPEAAYFVALPLDAVEAKLESVKQQVGAGLGWVVWVAEQAGQQRRRACTPASKLHSAAGRRRQRGGGQAPLPWFTIQPALS